MDFRDLLLVQHARTHAMGVGPADISYQDNVLRDLSDDQIRSRPGPEFNSIAWMLWHIGRVEDIGINRVLANTPQVLGGDWASRLGVDSSHLGSGMTGDEVDAFNDGIDVKALLDYRAEVGRQTQLFLREFDVSRLQDTIDANLIAQLRGEGVFDGVPDWLAQRWLGKPKSFTLMHTVLAHSAMHFGQADVNRKLLGATTI